MIKISDRSGVGQLWNFANEGVVAKKRHEQLRELGDGVSRANELVVREAQNLDLLESGPAGRNRASEAVASEGDVANGRRIDAWKPMRWQSRF